MGIKRRRRKSHPIRIVERKLGHERAMGQAWKGINLIEIDPRQRAKCYLNTLVHEMTHCLFPDTSESKVRTVAGKYTKAIWEAGYRRLSK